MNQDPIRCDICGRFISYRDLETKRVIRHLVTPDNAFGGEDWETHHLKCVKAEYRRDKGRHLV